MLLLNMEKLYKSTKRQNLVLSVVKTIKLVISMMLLQLELKHLSLNRLVSPEKAH